MKKTVLTTVSALLISTGGFGAANLFHADEAQAARNTHYSHVAVSEQTDITALPEYKTVASVIDLASLKSRVTEDNFNKRVILFTYDSGKGAYKSIFMKKTNTVKVIDFRGGELFYGSLAADKPAADTNKKPGHTVKPAPDANKKPAQPAKPAVPAAADQVKNLPEYATLASVADLSGMTVKQVEDNRGKRVLVAKDSNGRDRYKSIFMKHSSFVKVIDLQGGMLYNGKVK